MKMEGKLYEAAVKGSVTLLLNLLQEDALLLDRFITGLYPETPLHVASTLGHIEFVKEILSRKPELAKILDSRKSSPLHLATAKGYLDLVKRLLEVNPDMCSVNDFDGRKPLHIAAINGDTNVLRELLRVRPSAARSLMDEGETILHACVRDNQFEAFKLLVETVGDHEFVNCQNYDGNTVLHLAIANKQTEVINFLISSTTIEVNCENADGFNPLDLLSENERNLEDKEIVESLLRIGAINAKDKPLSNHQLKATRTKILSSPATSNETNASKPKKSEVRNRSKMNKKADWAEKKRNTLMLVASLLATMAFQAGVNPPSGVWQENKGSQMAGYSIFAENHPIRYKAFLILNTVGLVASLSIILLLISGLPFIRRRFFMWILMIVMWVAITAMAFAYLISISVFTPNEHFSSLIDILRDALFVWCGVMLLLLLGHTIRLIIRLIPHILGLIIRSKKAIFTQSARA